MNFRLLIESTLRDDKCQATIFSRLSLNVTIAHSKAKIVNLLVQVSHQDFFRILEGILLLVQGTGQMARFV